MLVINIKSHTVGDDTPNGKRFHVLFPGTIDVLSITRDDTHTLVECHNGALFLLDANDVEVIVDTNTARQRGATGQRL